MRGTRARRHRAGELGREVGMQKLYDVCLEHPTKVGERTEGGMSQKSCLASRVPHQIRSSCCTESWRALLNPRTQVPARRKSVAHALLLERGTPHLQQWFTRDGFSTLASCLRVLGTFPTQLRVLCVLDARSFSSLPSDILRRHLSSFELGLNC